MTTQPKIAKIPERMPAEDFVAFMHWAKKSRKWGRRELKILLGCGINQIQIWRYQGAPPYIMIACHALANGIGPMTATDCANFPTTAKASRKLASAHKSSAGTFGARNASTPVPEAPTARLNVFGIEP